MTVLLRMWLGAALGGLMLGLVVPVHAQDTLEEIIVTARKKEERLQEIPLSITAIPAEVLERKGIRDLKDIARLTPGM
jgi:iron complex outermembrane receptor protein